MGDGERRQGGEAILPRAVTETEDYTRAVKGAAVEAVRVGEGDRPNVVLGLPGDRVTVTSSQVGFPICTHAHIADSHILTALVHEVAEPSRWCGIPLSPGTVIVYAPGVEHTGVNQPGLRFTFAITETDALHELADRLETPIRIPPHGELAEVRHADRSRRLGQALSTRSRVATDGGDNRRAEEDVLSAMAALLNDDGRRAEVHASRGLDSKTLVHECIDYAESVERIPSIGELCRAIHVSERRLRSAFTAQFDQPPSQFMRAWALDRAHRRLQQADPGTLTVTEVAAGLGLTHLGRFAGEYRRYFGESPSMTLGNAAQTAIA